MDAKRTAARSERAVLGTVGKKMCPSARCRPGHVLLGVVEANGEIAFLPERVGVTQAFAAAARSYGAPEARFRFSAPCCRSACGQWNGDGCSIAAQAAVLAERPAIAADPRSPPHCSIREICQWFSERGEAVCRTCRFVITERRDNPSL